MKSDKVSTKNTELTSELEALMAEKTNLASELGDTKLQLSGKDLF